VVGPPLQATLQALADTGAEVFVGNTPAPTWLPIEAQRAAGMDPGDAADAMAEIDARTAALNALLDQEAAGFGNVHVVDVDAQVREIGSFRIDAGDEHLTYGALGGLVSLDGAHFTDTDYGLLAQGFVDAMNAQLGTAIPDIDVAAVMAQDPSAPPALRDAGAIPRTASGPLAAERAPLGRRDTQALQSRALHPASVPMSLVPAYKAAEIYRQRLQEAQDLLQSYQALQKDVDARRQEVAKAAEDACKALAVAYLPELTPAALVGAEKLTGYRGFSRRDPLKAMEREKKVIQANIPAIEQDERYTRRQYLVGPEGEYTRKLAEARDMLAPWETDCQRFEQIDGFLELIDAGYDTPSFMEEWWQPAYWKHWARGDAICEELKMDDFGDDVLPAYRKARQGRDEWREQVKAAEAKVAQVHDLVEQHDKLVARLPKLPEIYLDQCTTVLGTFLGKADPALLQQWLDADTTDEHRPIRVGLRRVAGLTSKADFLAEMTSKGIGKLIDGLEARIAKYHHKVAKYQRWAGKGRSVPEEALDQDFPKKADKLRKNHAAIRKTVDRMMAFEDYDRFDLHNDPSLWWVEFTGRKPSHLVPSLRAWYDRHPGAAPTHDPSVASHGATVAQAMAATGISDDLGYLS